MQRHDIVPDIITHRSVCGACEKGMERTRRPPLRA